MFLRFCWGAEYFPLATPIAWASERSQSILRKKTFAHRSKSTHASNVNKLEVSSNHESRASDCMTKFFLWPPFFRWIRCASLIGFRYENAHVTMDEPHELIAITWKCISCIVISTVEGVLQRSAWKWRTLSSWKLLDLTWKFRNSLKSWLRLQFVKFA